MKELLKKAFPFLTAAASVVPGGNLASTVLAKVLGINGANGKPISWDDLGNAFINMTPEQKLAADKEEHEFQLKMQELNINSAEELERIAAADRASARDREIKTGDKLTPRILSATVVGGWITVQTVLLFHIVDPSMRELVARVLGTLDSALILVLGYYFGSSAGSAEKNQLIGGKEK